MMWTITVALVVLWLSGLATGYTMGSFIHLFFAAAVILLVVSLSQEAMVNQKLRHVLYRRDRKPGSKQRGRRITDRPVPSGITP